MMKFTRLNSVKMLLAMIWPMVLVLRAAAVFTNPFSTRSCTWVEVKPVMVGPFILFPLVASISDTSASFYHIVSQSSSLSGGHVGLVGFVLACAIYIFIVSYQ